MIEPGPNLCNTQKQQADSDELQCDAQPMEDIATHPDDLSDHERLERVETRVYGVQLQVDQLQEDRADDARKLDQLRDQFRAEIHEATNAGWQLITAGLAASAIGIVLAALG